MSTMIYKARLHIIKPQPPQAPLLLTLTPTRRRTKSHPTSLHRSLSLAGCSRRHPS